MWQYVFLFLLYCRCAAGVSCAACWSHAAARETLSSSANQDVRRWKVVYVNLFPPVMIRDKAMCVLELFLTQRQMCPKMKSSGSFCPAACSSFFPNVFVLSSLWLNKDTGAHAHNITHSDHAARSPNTQWSSGMFNAALKMRIWSTSGPHTTVQVLFIHGQPASTCFPNLFLTL